MDQLRNKLSSASRSLQSNPNYSSVLKSSVSSSRCRRLAAIGPGVIAFLADDSNIFIINVSVGSNSAPQLLQLDNPLPASSQELVASNTEHGVFAVIANGGVAVVECSRVDLTARVIYVGNSLFLRRPELRVLHAEWSPHAEAFLALLTSDGCLRLFDVSCRKSAEAERFRLRVITSGAGPVSFAFGRAAGWDSLSVYILAEDGSLYVASPIAPIGTKISKNTWTQLRETALNVVEREESLQTEDDQELSLLRGDPFAATDKNVGVAPEEKLGRLSLGATPRRQLDFSPARTSPPPMASPAFQRQKQESKEKTWATMQAEMQLRFLTSVFESLNNDEMISVREFKPAPVLFQGPLFIEQDDAEDVMEMGAAKNSKQSSGDEIIFQQLTVLQHGPYKPPVLLRTSSNGETSVLISLEAVEAQWFLVNGSFGRVDDVLEGNEEYAEASRAVAPSLLCFEHLSFPGDDPVYVFPLRGRADGDVLFALLSTAVLSIRLPFLSIVDNLSALDTCPASSIAPLLDAGSVNGDVLAKRQLLGLAPCFEKGLGPVAIVIDQSLTLSGTPPLRWAFGPDSRLPSALVDSKSTAELSWNEERPLSGSRAYACPELGREVTETIDSLRTAEESQGWNVAEGTLTSIMKAKSVSNILDYLEARVEAYTGSDSQPGVADILSNLATVLLQWSEELESRSRGAIRGISVVQDHITATQVSGNALKRKVRRASELNENLRDRIAVLRKLLELGTGLSYAERERYTRLKERKRRLATMRKRMHELQVAVKSIRARQNAKEPLQTMTPARYGTASQKRWASSPGWGNSPLEKRKEEWKKVDERPELGPAELKRIKDVLEQHGKDIEDATNTCSTLWEKVNEV